MDLTDFLSRARRFNPGGTLSFHNIDDVGFSTLDDLDALRYRTGVANEMRRRCAELSERQAQRLNAPDWNAGVGRLVKPLPPGGIEYYKRMRRAYERSGASHMTDAHMVTHTTERFLAWYRQLLRFAEANPTRIEYLDDNHDGNITREESCKPKVILTNGNWAVMLECRRKHVTFFFGLLLEPEQYRRLCLGIDPLNNNNRARRMGESFVGFEALREIARHRCNTIPAIFPGQD